MKHLTKNQIIDEFKSLSKELGVYKVTSKIKKYDDWNKFANVKVQVVDKTMAKYINGSIDVNPRLVVFDLMKKKGITKLSKVEIESLADRVYYIGNEADYTGDGSLRYIGDWTIEIAPILRDLVRNSEEEVLEKIS